MIKKGASYSSRKYVIIAIFSIVVLVLMIKLFSIQVIDQSYKRSSENNTLRYVTQYPARGKVYDRNGNLLVYNEAIYDLMVIPRQVKKLDTLAFCSAIDITRKSFDERMKNSFDSLLAVLAFLLQQVPEFLLVLLQDYPYIVYLLFLTQV